MKSTVEMSGGELLAHLIGRRDKPSGQRPLARIFRRYADRSLPIEAHPTTHGADLPTAIGLSADSPHWFVAETLDLVRHSQQELRSSMANDRVSLQMVLTGRGGEIPGIRLGFFDDQGMNRRGELGFCDFGYRFRYGELPDLTSPRSTFVYLSTRSGVRPDIEFTDEGRVMDRIISEAQIDLKELLGKVKGRRRIRLRTLFDRANRRFAEAITHTMGGLLDDELYELIF